MILKLSTINKSFFNGFVISKNIPLLVLKINTKK